ncbi:hypothetical protein [Streptomyces sp. NPDC056821]|uniref:maleate cis-trans isomerase family protein n=1 Tax=unclassified Streptomyces TaxID=2593676 RepID=UPI0036BF5FBA
MSRRAVSLRTFAGETRLGLIVPSSNTNAESLTARMLAGTDVVALASRFPLPADLAAVVDDALLGPAAELIAEAGVCALAFHGTSGSWLGLDADRRTCATLRDRTGVAATTASLATVSALQALGAQRVGLVFPGPAEIADGIAREYGALGIDVVAIATAPRPLTNPEISRLDGGEIAAMIRPAAAPGADAVVCVGTNLRAAYLVADLEREFGVPVVDSAAATVWELLGMADRLRELPGWGALFTGAPTA